MNLNKVLATAKAAVEADPKYRIYPKTATAIEYNLQHWAGRTGGWATVAEQDDLETNQGLEGFSNIVKLKMQMEADNRFQVYRIVALVVVSEVKP